MHRLVWIIPVLLLSLPAAAEPTELVDALDALDDPARAQPLVAGLESRAADGDADAQYWLGRYHHDLAPFPQRDFAAARDLLERASDAGHLRATELLARLYENGFAVPVDRERAASFYQRALEMDSVDAAHDLARLAFAAVPRDDEAVVRHLTHAAERGHRGAMVDLAFIHATGTLGTVDGEAAHGWALRGAQRRSPRAMLLLAQLYAGGVGVDADPVESLKWALLAREFGDPAAVELTRDIAAQVPEAVHEEARMRARGWMDGGQ